MATDDKMTLTVPTLDSLDSRAVNKDEFWKGSMDEYFGFIYRQPSIVYTAPQRLYQAVTAFGCEEYEYAKLPHRHYPFFDDPFGNGEDAIFGLDHYLAYDVDVLKAAASGFGPDKRILLLLGPVGSSKSTIARLLRKGLAAHTHTDAGKLYTFSWYVNPQHDDRERLLRLFGIVGTYDEDFVRCPLHEEPLLLLPPDVRQKIITDLNQVPVTLTDEEIEKLPASQRKRVKDHTRDRQDEARITLSGELCPFCRSVWRKLMDRYDADWKRIINEHIRVERLTFSEEDRVGIGSFHPKDEKNQDSTELSGDINWSKIAQFGSESDPRAFDFKRGEYCVANRGLLYKEEMLKADKAFLYDDLHVSQDKVVKPKGFSVMHLDIVLVGGTNLPEYKAVCEDDKMEAFQDRIVDLRTPYVVRVSQEEKIYARTFKATPGKHLDPHVRKYTAMLAVLSRLVAPGSEHHLSLMQKLKLYDGEFIGEDYTPETVRTLLEEAEGKEGMEAALSPRFSLDKISNAVVHNPNDPCVTTFAVFEELEAGINSDSRIKGAERRQELLRYLAQAREEFDEEAKGEVEQAIGSDEKGLLELYNNYIANLRAYMQRGAKATVYNPDTKQDEPYNERLMREIEQAIGVADGDKDQFRTLVYNGIANMALEGKTFDYRSNERLLRALRKKLFDDRKDTIKLSTINTRVLDHDEQDKIDVVKRRLKEMFGLCDFCANIELRHVASIIARGEAAKEAAARH